MSGHDRRQDDGFAIEVMKKFADISLQTNNLATAQAVANKTLEYIGDALHDLKKQNSDVNKKDAEQDLKIQAAATEAGEAKIGIKSHIDGHWRFAALVVGGAGAVVGIIGLIFK